MTNTTTLAPTDAEIWREWELILATSNPTAGTAAIKLVRTAIAKWGAPAPASGEPVAWAATSADGVVEALGMNQSRRFDTPLFATPPAQEAQVPLTSEQQRCIAEAHNVAACEEYFSARPQIDCTANRRIFEAGFSKGYGIITKK